ncbi:MAG: redoxin domain-containing protein [Phycisphaerae bacterium]|jgi:peroxiredoxin/outer membrane lipoprotein-sorting protein
MMTMMCAVLIGATALVGSQPQDKPPPPAESLTAEQVVAHYVDALGGAEKLAARKTLRMTCRITREGDQETAELIREWKRPDKFRASFTVSLAGRTLCLVIACDGKTWWHIMPVFGSAEPQEAPAEMVEVYDDEADIDDPLAVAAAMGHKVELIGREELDGKPVYKLKLMRKGAAEEEYDEYYIDAESWLPAKVAGARRAMGAVVRFERTLSDYRRVDGVMVAHVQKTVSEPDNSVQELRIEKVETNIDVSDERFSLAAAKKAAEASAPTTAPAESAKAVTDEPAAHALYDRMIAALRAADTLAFDSAYTLKLGAMPGTTCWYKAWLAKPNYFRLEATHSSGKLTGVLVGDGRNLWVYWPSGRPYFSDGATPEDQDTYEATRDKVYMSKPTPLAHHSIGHEVALLGSGIIMNILDLSTFHGYTDGLQPLLDGVAGCGTETFADEPCDVIKLSYMDGQRAWRLWISQRDHLPRKLSERVHVAHTIQVEEVWSNIRLNEPIPDEQFVWTPPEDWQLWQIPQTEQALVPVGEPAPDFELKLAEGGTTKLSDYRGKFVWLVFWRVGCPPCRQETVFLQKLHEKHAGKELVVLGFNSADRRDIALDLLRKQKVTFPCVLDSSTDAMQMSMMKYHASAVPTTYIIDREGKVLMAWVGFSDDDPRAEEALKKMGLE